MNRRRAEPLLGPFSTHLQDGDLREVFLLEIGVSDQLQLCLKETVKRLQTEEPVTHKPEPPRLEDTVGRHDDQGGPPDS